jgi:hypothetical protein
MPFRVTEVPYSTTENGRMSVLPACFAAFVDADAVHVPVSMPIASANVAAATDVRLSLGDM